MDEKLIVGAIWGVMLVIMVFAYKGVMAVAKSQSEGARRIKLVLMVAAFFGGGALAISALGLGPAFFLVAIFGVIVWVRQGFKK